MNKVIVGLVAGSLVLGGGIGAGSVLAVKNAEIEQVSANADRTLRASKSNHERETAEAIETAVLESDDQWRAQLKGTANDCKRATDIYDGLVVFLNAGVAKSLDVILDPTTSKMNDVVTFSEAYNNVHHEGVASAEESVEACLAGLPDAD